MSEPIIRSSAGTPAPVCTDWSCQTLARPRSMKLIPRVTISGWTRKTPTAIPDTRPARTAAANDTTIAWATPPGLWIRVAVTNPAIEATALTDRSIPPVSIVSVWQAARIARGTALRTITPAQLGVTIPGEAIPMTITRIARRPLSGMIGWSRNRLRRRAAVTLPRVAAGGEGGVATGVMAGLALGPVTPAPAGSR